MADNDITTESKSTRPPTIILYARDDEEMREINEFLNAHHYKKSPFIMSLVRKQVLAWKRKTAIKAA